MLWSGVGGQLLSYHLLWSGVGGQLLSYRLLWSGVGGQLLSYHLLWSGVGGQLLSYHVGGQYCTSSLEGPFRGAFGKNILIMDTGLDIVCGPQGELCACYHNGFQLGFAQLEVSDLDFISCWLAEDDTLPGASEVSVGACDGSNQPRLGSRAWARS